MACLQMRQVDLGASDIKDSRSQRDQDGHAAGREAASCWNQTAGSEQRIRGHERSRQDLVPGCDRKPPDESGSRHADIANPGDRACRCLGVDLLDICGTESLDLAALLQGRLEKPEPGKASITPVRTKRRLLRVDHDRLRSALTEAIKSGELVTQVAERLRVDVSTLAEHRALYERVRRTTRERKAAAESARQDAAIASAEAVAVKLVQGNVRLTHRNALRAGSRSYPSDTAAAVLAMIRIGLGDRTVRYPAMAARMGEPFLKKIELAVQRVGAVAGVPQERLPLQYR